MFEESDTEVCDLNYKTRESLIPDPEGDEIRNIAKSKGFTAFCSKIFKGEETSEALLVSAEVTDVGESSHDSPIVSVERIKRDPDSSRPTTMTSVPDSQATDLSTMSSLICTKRLAVEKKCLKKIIEIKELEGIQYDFIGDQIWKKNTLAKLSKLTEENLENVAKSDANDVLQVWSDLDVTSTDANKHLYHVSLDSRYMETSIYIHFFRAIFYAILSRSEVICYITIVINQITSA
ncbi:hypothetical protein BLA29_008365, partial [Euroglyphus maynei]